MFEPKDDDIEVRQAQFAAACARRAAFRAKVASSSGTGQAPVAAITANDSPLAKAVDRLISAGQATAEAPDTMPADPLMRAIERLAGRAGQ